MDDSDNSEDHSGDHSGATLRISSSFSPERSLNRASKQQARGSYIPRNDRKLGQSRRQEREMMDDDSVKSDRLIATPQDFAEAAKLVKQSITSTIEAWSTWAEDCLVLPDDKTVGTASITETSTVPDLKETSFVSEDSVEDVAPPALMNDNEISSFFPNVHRPIPITTTTRVRTSSPVYTDVEQNVELDRKSPMARMREATPRAPEVKKDQPPKKSGEDLVAEKHRKWRQQIKLAQERRQKRLGDDLVDPLGCSADGSSHTVELFQRLVRGTRCGHMDDAASYASSSSGEYDESFDDSSSEEMSEAEPPAEERKIQPTRSSSTNPFDDDNEEEQLERKIPTPRATANPFEDDHGEELPESEIPTPRATAKRPVPETAVPATSTSITDKNFIKAFIANLTQNGIALIWHHTSTSTKDRPSHVRMVLQPGSERADGSFSAPRLVWNTEDGATSEGSVDLFDIVSLDKATPLELEGFVFAVPGNSLFLRMSSGDNFVFEASNDESAQSFIHGLRWVVARLAFNLIIGNRDVSCELLTVSTGEDKTGEAGWVSPGTMDEIMRNKAMDDVTNLLVDKSVFATNE